MCVCRLRHPNKPPFPALLGSFLEEVVCAGVNVGGDCTILAHSYSGFPHVQTVDLAHTAMDTKLTTLSMFVEWAAGKPLSKPSHIRCGDWGRRPLTQEQQTYAALDVLAPLIVVEKLAREGFKTEAKRGRMSYVFSTGMNVASASGSSMPAPPATTGPPARTQKNRLWDRACAATDPQFPFAPVVYPGLVGKTVHMLGSAWGIDPLRAFAGTVVSAASTRSRSSRGRTGVGKYQVQVRPRVCILLSCVSSAATQPPLHSARPSHHTCALLANRRTH